MAEAAHEKRAKIRLAKGVPAADADWFPGTLRKFVQLLDLPPDWDGYGARPVDPAVVKGALRLLLELVPTAASVPNVVPSPSGGVQVEWHERGADIELEFKVDATASFFMETDNGEVEESAPIGRIGEVAGRSLGRVFAGR